MEHPVSHYFLVHSQSAALCRQHVERYLTGNPLITYTDFLIREEEVLRGSEDLFLQTLEQGLAANIAFARRMVDHLREEGVDRLDQLLTLEQGYATKVLHTLAHILDGFIGVDSVFYNLVEDSHRVSPALAAAIGARPAEYWLVPVRTGKVAAAVLHPKD
jgi:hypothetical protein